MAYYDEHGRPIYEVVESDPIMTITGEGYLGDLYSDGAAYTGLSIIGNAYLPDIESDALVINGFRIVGDAYLPDLYSEGIVTGQGIITGDAYLPALHADGYVGTKISIIGDAYLPSLYMDGTVAALLVIDGDAFFSDIVSDGLVLLVIPEVYATWLFNAKNFAHSRYGSEYSFNSLFELNGKVYGCGGATAGIHEITGKKDGASNISASVTWGVSELGTPNKKTAINAFIACRSEGDLTFSTINDEDTLTAYTVDVDTTKQGIHTEPTGSLAKGLKKRYWQPKIANVDGADFDIVGLEMRVQDLSRTA